MLLIGCGEGFPASDIGSGTALLQLGSLEEEQASHRRGLPTEPSGGTAGVGLAAHSGYWPLKLTEIDPFLLTLHSCRSMIFARVTCLQIGAVYMAIMLRDGGTQKRQRGLDGD